LKNTPSGTSDKIETIHRRLVWPLRKDDTHKSRNGIRADLSQYDGSRTNQAEAGGHVTPPLGGHVTPEADEGGEWSGSWHASRQN